MVRVVCQKGGDAEISEEDGAVVIDEEVCGFDIAMDATVGVEIAEGVG